VLLPDFNFFVRLAGMRSLGRFLLGPELRGEDGNEAQHRTLRDFMRGETVSQKRMEKLADFVVANFNGTGSIDPEKSTINFPEGSEPFQTSDPYLVSLSAWDALSEGLPEHLQSTRIALKKLAAASRHLHDQQEQYGPAGLSRELRRITPARPRHFFASVAAMTGNDSSLPRSPVDVLQVFGLISLIATLVADGAEDSSEAEANLRLIFSEQNGAVNPSRAFADWLHRQMNADSSPGKMEFIHQAFGSSDTDVRTAHRYFAGDDVPTYEKAMDIISNLDFDLPGSEIKQIELGLLLVLLMSNSSHHLKEGLGVFSHDEVHQFVFDESLAQLNAGPAT